MGAAGLGLLQRDTHGIGRRWGWESSGHGHGHGAGLRLAVQELLAGGDATSVSEARGEARRDARIMWGPIIDVDATTPLETGVEQTGVVICLVFIV